MEIWRKIDGYPLYEVSNAGRVRSIDRVVPSSNRFGAFDKAMSGRVLKEFKAGRYRAVQLGADAQNSYVHRLVAGAFCKQRPEADCVNHIDGDRANNAASNLEWCTWSENALHSTHVLGNRRGQYVAVQRG